MRKAIFLDKDGTLIKDVSYNVDPSLIVLEENCTEGLKLLQDEGYLLVIISNQSGVAHGYFSENKLEGVRLRLDELLGEHGVKLDAMYYCPHHPKGSVSPYAINCDCRKPMPGMIIKASKDFNIDLSASWMIGDILNDVEAGNRAGCRTILIDNGNETEWIKDEYREPTYKASSINEAASFIFQQVVV
ncbi:D-glycero-alpha-D-manno-heptose-1,7-bisphosphate 7-phosphatase [Chryseosolibacter indicus]|uniref:D,D-heptose 1,7-bisphosphate phosphatase n=1 Tax=Chryseosolibacter indicus TaxID=2782351 RepID=A0ABS5VQX5_9BACT|nr:HAD family hydrolase [Chryseosolibacter indicus]MBT1703818.1 HAD family hydrolase [Chryseosolibacter indicus]